MKSKEHFEKALSTIYKGNISELKKILIENNDLINYKDKEGRSLLIYSILDKNVEATKIIVESGANVNIKDRLGYTPLHYASQNYLAAIARILLENNAEVNAKDNFGNTVVARAVYSSNGRGEIIQLLKSFGADVSIKNNSGVSALDLANRISNYDVKQFL